MERLSTYKRAAVIRQYLSGMSYDEIAAKVGVSKGTVANVITELKTGKFTETVDLAEHIESLRELSIDLNRLKMTPTQCIAGLAVLNRINECGLDPADINRWPMIIKTAGNEADAEEFVKLVYSIQEVQQRTGLDLEEFDNKVHELENKAVKLEPLLTQYEGCRKQLDEINKQREQLTVEVTYLDRQYDILSPKVKDLEQRDGKLSRHIKSMEEKTEKAEAAVTMLNQEQRKLRDTGFTLESLTEFNEKTRFIARHHHISPSDVRDRLIQELTHLDEGLGLETLIQNRQTELKQQEQVVAAAKQESESLKVAINNLKQEKANLEAGIKAVKEKVSQEMMKIVPLARSTINQFTEVLRHGQDRTLVEINRLKDEAMEVGKEIGKFEEIIQTNQWLHELIALIRGENNIEGQRVRVITLLVLQGTRTWMKQSKTDKLAYAPLLFGIENLVKELEQWKI